MTVHNRFYKPSYYIVELNYQYCFTTMKRYSPISARMDYMGQATLPMGCGITCLWRQEVYL